MVPTTHRIIGSDYAAKPLEEILGGKVGLGTPASLKARIHEHVMEDCFYVTSAFG